MWFYSLLANWKLSNQPQKNTLIIIRRIETLIRLFKPQEEAETGDVRTHSDLHRQLALAGIFGVDGELHREAGREAGGEPGAAGTHFTGIMSGLNTQLERTERDVWGIGLI